MSPRESSLSHGQSLGMESLESFLYVRYWWFCYILLQQWTLPTSWANRLAEISWLTMWTPSFTCCSWLPIRIYLCDQIPMFPRSWDSKWASLTEIFHTYSCVSPPERKHGLCAQQGKSRRPMSLLPNHHIFIFPSAYAVLR